MTFLRELKEFVVNIAHDPRIPERDKKVLLALMALIISPIDFIPDWIAFFGQLDDIVMIAIVLDYFFYVLESTVLLSHYPWGMKSFARLRSVARLMSFLVPTFLKRRIWQYVGDPY